MPLKHISANINVSYRIASPNDPCHIPKHIAKVCLAEFTKTIESFCLKSISTFSSPIDFAEIKDNLYNLVELRLTPSTPIDIDTLLCAPPHLKSLELQKSDIKLKNGLNNANRFGLQSFSVHDTSITSDVLRFLSFHCRSLNELNLKYAKIHGNFTTPGCQFIDMTYTNLKKMHIEYTKFLIQDNNECPENLNIALITRPIDNFPSKQYYDYYLLPIFCSSPPPKAYNDWFYIAYGNKMVKVSSEQGSRVETFVLNYEQNKRITSKSDYDESERMPGIILNSNCVFGYTKIKLGHVADFRIEFFEDENQFSRW